MSAHVFEPLSEVGRPQTVLALRPSVGSIFSPSASESMASSIELSVVDNQFAALLMIPEVKPVALLIPADANASSRIEFLSAVTAWTDLPIIIGLTPDSTDDFIIESVAMGVTRFIYLPCDEATLIAEVSTLPAVPNSVLRIESVELDEAGLTVRADHTRVQLSVPQFAILQRLGRAYPRAVPLNELYAEGDYTVESLRTVISRVRETLLAGDVPLVIETIRGHGYRLAAP